MLLLLFAGTVLKLGTKIHHDQLLKGIDSLDAVGCFALTELGYGGHLLLHFAGTVGVSTCSTI